jgi:PAS domain S-box-containing protein
MEFDLLELMPDAVVVSGPDGSIRYVNAMTEKVFGYVRAELLGRPLEILMPARFRRGHLAQRQEYDAAPRVRPMGSGLQLFGLKKSGQEFPIDISLGPVQMGGERYVIAAVRDVTERKAFEERLRELERAEEEVRRREELVRLRELTATGSGRLRRVP